MKRASALLVITMWGCHRTPVIVSGSIEIGPEPKVFRLSAPVNVVGSGWETCFDFNTPGDSHEAQGIDAALIDAKGARYELSRVELDRRGESIVCHVGSLAAGSTALEAIELSARVPLRIRAIRGASF